MSTIFIGAVCALLGIIAGYFIGYGIGYDDAEEEGDVRLLKSLENH